MTGSEVRRSFPGLTLPPPGGQTCTNAQRVCIGGMRRDQRSEQSTYLIKYEHESELFPNDNKTFQKLVLFLRGIKCDPVSIAFFSSHGHGQVLH
ncbi:hypothetical protein ElyMa_003032400 [Elysia marginata]|uniref:Uncharacterized protein n=1 Tax=Elysia marginata TaxID=1093978 RepID=A0AAV4IE65_9GAST|nr:hypothetical protein ElyMa_003032400 [Elysia marginata]